jgi:beta-lactamase class A
MEPAQTAGMSYREIEDFLNAYEPAPGELDAAADAFEEDPRDSATPLGMNALLQAIFERRAASPASCDRMVEIMLQCDTGRNRLQGFLPDGVRLAHKTGTLGGTVNDVGVMYLPGGRGRVLVSVLTKGMKDRARAEKAIAQVARYAYDYFLFNAPSTGSPGTGPGR